MPIRRDLPALSAATHNTVLRCPLAGIYLSEQTVTSLLDAGPPAGSVPVHLIVGGSEGKSRRSSP
jgi:hypothetical protein